VCAEDDELARELASLLEHDATSHDFLDHAAMEVAARELVELEMESAPVEAGGQIGAYKILEQIARGGMGVVYRAEQQYPVRRIVALKIIKPGMDTVEVVARFGSERQALAVMDHPAIAKVFAAGSTPQGRPYFVMEYVIGTSILDYCDQHKLTIPQRLRLFVSVCEGVQHAHYKSIVHRDLKPSNILVVDVDGKPAPKIIDFGIAKALQDDSSSSKFASLTSVGAIVGTPQYMSPEQADGSDLDTRTDVYSLGVVLYELLVGALPLDFTKTPLHQFAQKLQSEDAPRPSTKVRTLGAESSTNAGKRGADVRALTRQLRGDLDAITLKALEKDRNRRYSTPADLAVDLERYLRHEPVMARPAGIGYRTGKYLLRHRIGVALGSFTVLLLAVAAIAQTMELRKTKRERDRADRVTQFMTRMFVVSNPSEAHGNDIRAREILDKASRDIEKGLADDPQLRAQMMDVMGNVYNNLGLYAAADKLLREAVTVRRNILGVDNAATLQSMSALGDVLISETRYEEAEKLLHETVQRRRVLLGAEHRDTLNAMSRLALLLNSQSKFADAEKINREVRDTARRVFGATDPLVGTASRRLAMDLAYEGRYPEAEKEFRELLAIDRKKFGADHPTVVGDLNNVGAILQQQRRYADAETVYSEALGVARKVFGPEHPTTLLTMGNLGQVFTQDGRGAEALKLLREVYAAKRKTLGPENRSTLVTGSNLAYAMRMTNQLREAETLVRENLQVTRRVLGPMHTDTLVTQETLGDILKAEGRYAEAAQVLRKTLEDRRETLGVNHPYVAETFYRLACVLALAGKRDEAFSNLQSAAELALKESSADVEQEPDLKSLHADSRFGEILKILGAREAAAPAGKAADSHNRK
jgi:eukaryotic-like serine/threonine-protein kinase